MMRPTDLNQTRHQPCQPESNSIEPKSTNLISGCFCDEGHVRSGNNCIDNSKCFSSCALDNGIELAIGQSHMNADCSQTCTCVENYFDSTQPPRKFFVPAAKTAYFKQFLIVYNLLLSD